MDDPSDGSYSRAPELEDLVELGRWLNAEGVRYMLIGGFAVVLHGSVRGTKDIDLLVDASDDNIRLLKRAMGRLPDNAIALIDDADIRNYTVVRIADEIVVDLMASACGIDYHTAVRDGLEHTEIEGTKIPLASKQLLIRMKDTIRDSDRSDVSFLRVLIEEEEGAED